MANETFMKNVRHQEFRAALDGYLQISTLDADEQLAFRARLHEIVENAGRVVTMIKDKFNPGAILRYELRQRLAEAYETAEKWYAYEAREEPVTEDLGLSEAICGMLWKECLCSGILDLIEDLDKKSKRLLSYQSIDVAITERAREMFFDILTLLIDHKIKLSRSKQAVSKASDKLLTLIEKSFLCAGFKFRHIPQSGSSRRRAEAFRNFFRNEWMRASENHPLIRVIDVEAHGLNMQDIQYFYEDRYVYIDYWDQQDYAQKFEEPTFLDDDDYISDVPPFICFPNSRSKNSEQPDELPQEAIRGKEQMTDDR